MGRKKAQALLFALFLLTLAGTLAGALAMLWTNEISIRSLDRESLSAFYLAQAGIEMAKIEARTGSTTAPDWSSERSLAGGRYYFYIEDTGANQRLLRSIGQRLSSSGNLIAERRIEVVVQGIGAPPESQVSGSWREI